MSDARGESTVETESGQPVVLVVDDDEDVADTYALWLDEYEVHTAYSGHEALDTLTDDVDVVLLDRRMPNMPGDEVLKRIRERNVDCQVSMLTAVEPDSDLTSLDFDDYLVKPVTRSNVVDVVNELLIRSSLDEETQEYLALKSTADAIENHSDSVRDPDAVETLQEQVEEAGRSPTVQAEAAGLQRLKQLNELIRSVDQAVVAVDSKDELDEAICEQFVERSPYEYALIGQYTEAYDELIPSATNTEASDLEPTGCGPGDPIRAALMGEEVQVVHYDDHPDSSVWTFQEMIAEGESFPSAIVVPVSYRDSVRGVVLLWTDERIELQDRERSVLHEVGTTIGNAIDSLQTREIVHADTVVEIELQVTDRTDVFVDLSATHDCRAQLDGINFSSDEGVVCYLTVAGGPSEDIVDFLVTHDSTSNCRVIDDRGGDVLVECTVADDSIALNLLEASASVKNLFIDSGRGTVTVEVPPDRNLRGVLGTVKDDFDGVTLASKRNVDRSYQSIEGFRASLEEKLTERQDAVISAAYNAGYFDWPRGSTAEEVAEDLGMAPPTFHEHLREAQRKQVEVYLDEVE